MAGSIGDVLGGRAGGQAGNGLKWDKTGQGFLYTEYWSRHVTPTQSAKGEWMHLPLFSASVRQYSLFFYWSKKLITLPISDDPPLNPL